MEKKTIDELTHDMMSKEVNFTQIDGALTAIHSNYEISNSVILNMVLYSHMIAFGFNNTEDAVKMVQMLLTEYSSFELRELAVTLLGLDAVEFYKDTTYVDYAASSNPMVRALQEASDEVAKSFDDMDNVYAKLGELLPDTQK